MHVSVFKIFKTPICMCCSVCTIFAYCVSPKGTLTAFPICSRKQSTKFKVSTC